MSHPILHQILTQVAARDARELTVELGGTHEEAPYRVRCRGRHAFVDRVLAVELREHGARWTGDIARDPCAVA